MRSIEPVLSSGPNEEDDSRARLDELRAFPEASLVGGSGLVERLLIGLLADGRRPIIGIFLDGRRSTRP